MAGLMYMINKLMVSTCNIDSGVNVHDKQLVGSANMIHNSVNVPRNKSIV